MRTAAPRYPWRVFLRVWQTDQDQTDRQMAASDSRAQNDYTLALKRAAPTKLTHKIIFRSFATHVTIRQLM